MRTRVILAALIICCASISFLSEPGIIKPFLYILLAFSALTSKEGLRNYFFRRQDFFFWAYIILLSLGILNAPKQIIALRYYRDFSLCAAALYFVCRNEINNRTIWVILFTFTLCASIVAIIGILECLLHRNIIYEYWVNNSFYHRYLGYGRIMSTLVHPNITGAYLLSCIPCLWLVYTRQRKALLRAMAWTAFLIVAAAMLLTYSRGTWISLVLMLTLWGILRKKIKYAAWAWLGLAFVILIASHPSLNSNESYLARYRLKTLERYFSHSHRALQYKVASRMISAHPLAGVGLAHYRILFDKFSSVKLKPELKTPDSIYLMQLAEAGILAFVAFLLFIVHLGTRAIKTYTSLPLGEKEPLFIFLMGYAGLLINMGSFDGFLWRTPLYLFWIFAGIIAALSERKNNADSHQSVAV